MTNLEKWKKGLTLVDIWAVGKCVRCPARYTPSCDGNSDETLFTIDECLSNFLAWAFLEAGE